MALTLQQILTTKVKNLAISTEDRELALLEIEQRIKNYCNILTIPEALIFTWANMAADLLRWEKAVNTPPPEGDSSEAEVAGAVASIHEGDTSVSFGGESASTAERSRTLKTREAFLKEVIFNYREQLNEWRKVRWSHGTTT